MTSCKLVGILGFRQSYDASTELVRAEDGLAELQLWPAGAELEVSTLDHVFARLQPEKLAEVIAFVSRKEELEPFGAQIGIHK